MSANIIAAHEGQSVHNSLIDAIVAQEIRRQNDARVAEAVAARRRAETESQLMRAAYTAHWREKIDDAAEMYEWNPSPCRAARALMGGVGLVVLAFAALFERIERG